MADAGNELAKSSLLVDEQHRAEALVEAIGEGLCSTVQRTTEAVTLESIIEFGTILSRMRELTIVSRPDTREEMRSLPARAQTMVLWAPLTAGPWSAVSIRQSSKNLFAYSGRRF